MAGDYKDRVLRRQPVIRELADMRGPAELDYHREVGKLSRRRSDQQHARWRLWRHAPDARRALWVRSNNSACASASASELCLQSPTCARIQDIHGHEAAPADGLPRIGSLCADQGAERGAASWLDDADAKPDSRNAATGPRH